MNATEARQSDALAAFILGMLGDTPRLSVSPETPKVNGISAEAEAEVIQYLVSVGADRITEFKFNIEVSDLQFLYGIAKEPAQHALAIIQAGQVFTALKPKHDAAVAAEDWALAGYYGDQIVAALTYSGDLQERFDAQEEVQ